MPAHYYLFFSDVFVELWAKAFELNPLHVLSFDWEMALTIFLVVGLTFLALMVYLTGGGINSPFVTFCGLFPVLSILFKKELSWMILYLIWMLFLGTIVFMINAPYENGKVKSFKFRLSFLVGEVSSIIIATFIGVIST